ncbi:MAG TPA: glyoxalase [Candidatus Marinimicrobia bacterium]|jgi:extradiol dioxygenase family protein|nr:glyoxalase [Candidatus Neomarinimicrobiota bacterium]
MSAIRPFHLAIPVHDLEIAREFYGDILGCSTGRESENWIDFNFFGHQLVTHLDKNMNISDSTNTVDGDRVPVPHFGIILKKKDWDTLAKKLSAANVDFIIEPRTRFKDNTGEQSTMFIKDPSGNALEFKSFQDDGHIFTR